MRTLALALALALALGGCAKKGEDLQPDTIQTGVLSGVVTDAALTPLAGVNVTVTDAQNATMLTDGAGAFRFVLPPGEHVVVARLDGYNNGAGRADVLAAGVIALNLTLTPIPKVTPRVESLEGNGLIACALAVRNGGDVADQPCPSQDANARPEVSFDVMDTTGLAGAVIELAWTSGSKASDTLSMNLSIVNGDEVLAMGHAEGKSPLGLTVPGRLFEGKLAPGSQLRVGVAPTGSFADEESAIDLGAAVNQEFTAYLSLFYYAPPSAGFSVIQGP